MSDHAAPTPPQPDRPDATDPLHHPPVQPDWPADRFYREPQPRNGLGTAALVLGIIGAAVAVVPLLFWLAFPLVVLALTFGLIGSSRVKKGRADNKGTARAGWILGAVGLLLSTIWFIAFITAAANAANDIDQVTDDMNSWLECTENLPYDAPDSEWDRCNALLEES